MTQADLVPAPADAVPVSSPVDPPVENKLPPTPEGYIRVRNLTDCPSDWDPDELVQETFIKGPPDGERLVVCGVGCLYYWPDDPSRVVKVARSTPEANAQIEIEKRIYSRFEEKGYHPNIIKCLRYDDSGIYLERAEHGSLTAYFEEGGDASLTERLQWSYDLADAIQYLHDLGIRHADLVGRNILLDSSRRVRLCDFGGSGIDGEKPIVVSSVYYGHPDDDERTACTVKAELHTLGSVIYEISTSRMPFHDKRGYDVGQLFKKGIYPDVKDIVLGDVIAKCWAGEFTTAREVAESIKFAKGRALQET
ncbi:predicted protein [Uncinocarpus reesii 1704]|uniref:Protein kinase domain-containing protein n=1 Tax=Uncinocarpus reesii (strain UAMH 1704) TaxID=336963 RepID=C4JPL1_UNCRE|nr:uncharacterized protein UREG_03183 [Uncinocarpus reesii 1704]EEP78337.1 predicted protein [Uncinocarpus reesii 1704]